jgi:integrase
MSSGRFKAEIHLPTGRKVSKTFDRRKDAEAWGQEQQSNLARGTFIDPARGRMFFAAWSEEWFASAQDLAPSTKARYEICLQRELVPEFGDTRLLGISHESIQRWVNGQVARPSAAATVRKNFNLLRSILGAAVTADRIGRNPCSGVRLPRISRSEMRFLSAEELHRLSEAVDDRFRVLILTAGFLGPRWSELIALRTSDLALLERRLKITRGLVEVGGRFYEGPPKSSHGIRTMSVPSYLADQLGAHIGRYPNDDGLIFSGPKGGSLRKTWVARHFKPAVADAALDPLRVHDLRHTAAGLAIALGAHPKVIQERLGHSSIKVTLDTYGHLFPNLDAALTAGLDELARQAAASAPPATGKGGIRQSKKVS